MLDSLINQNFELLLYTWFVRCNTQTDLYNDFGMNFSKNATLTAFHRSVNFVSSSPILDYVTYSPCMTNLEVGVDLCVSVPIGAIYIAQEILEPSAFLTFC
jgi:hypothetical protein